MKIHGLFVLICLLVTRLASAQETGATLLRRAYELRRDGHDEEALPLLMQAYTADPSPRIAAQLALAEQATTSWQSASEHLRVALAAPNDPWIARHLEALEGAYALVLARLPQEPRVVALPRPPVVEHTIFVRDRPTIIVRNTSHFPARTVGWVAVGAGSVLAIGGAVSIGIRYAVVASFNDHGCLVGNPTIQPGCDLDATRSGRDVATALAITGAVTGVSLGAVGAALLLGAVHDNQRHATTAWFCVPSSNGLHASIACSVQF